MSSAALTATAPTTGIDLDVLLAPIAGPGPAGESLQYAGLHDEIREARRADEDLAQGDWKRELKLADWPRVIELATDAVANRTKDLQVCAWLSEALVKRRAFSGLHEGLRLMRGLHEQFWDDLYPEIDEGDLEARANSLYWMDRQLSLAIKEVPITNRADGVNYSYLHWLNAKESETGEGAPEPGGAQEGKITNEEWRKANGATRRAFYEETYALLTQSWEEFLALERVVDDKFGRQAPSLIDLKKTLDDLRTVVEKLVKEKRILEPDPAAAQQTSVANEAQLDPASGAFGFGSATGPIQTRREALKRLAEVAEYFRGTEPHSPVSYLVQRAISWGEMPLDTWLQDVIKDGGVLANLRETLGLKGGCDGE